MPSAGYLDEKRDSRASSRRQDGSGSGSRLSGDMRSRTEMLMAHMNSQSWHRRIRPSGHADDVDGDEEDAIDERQQRRRRRRRRSAAGTYESTSDDDDDGSDLLSSVSTCDSEEEERRAQQEWDESVAQLQLALQVMVLPFFGKWLGRRWSYWAFTRYQQHGITAAFFGLDWVWAPTSIVPSPAVAAIQP